MTQSEFNTLFKSGDQNTLWAAVENHIVQRESAIAAAADSEIAEKNKALTALTDAIFRAKQSDDPKAILAEATKSDTDKKRAALTAEIAEKQAQLATLDD